MVTKMVHRCLPWPRWLTTGPHAGNRMTALHLEQGWCQLSFPSMHTSTQYGTFAEECDRLAKEAQAERHRMVLKEMAEAWRTLAEEADRIGEQPRR
jgi:hypothetical protein